MDKEVKTHVEYMKKPQPAWSQPRCERQGKLLAP